MKAPKKYWWIAGLLLALGVALLSPLASPHPDGLERVAEDQGFLERARGPLYRLIPDYLFPGIQNEAVATILAGVVGTVFVFGLVFGVTWLLRRRTKHSTS